MQFLTIAFVSVAAAYILLIVLVIIGFRRLKVKSCKATPGISVVIAARNEEKRILPTLQALEKLDYPKEKYEIILVDDASTDRTAELIEEFTSKHDHWRLIRFRDKSAELRGKKKALRAAIKEARFDLIFTTDADCVVPGQWLKTMSCYFDNSTTMVLGHSPLETGNRLLDFDNLFSAIAGAVSAAWGYPLTSVGRNLAYRKAAYEEVGGFDALKKYRSGDDVHLTERFRSMAKGKIEYCIHPGSFVKTRPPSTRREIFHQQVRKNSKTLQKSFGSIFFSILLFGAYMMFMFLPVAAPRLFALWAGVMVIKFLAEWLALSRAVAIFNKPGLKAWLIPMQIIYPFYIIFFSLLGVLQIYQWKK